MSTSFPPKEEKRRVSGGFKTSLEFYYLPLETLLPEFRSGNVE